MSGKTVSGHQSLYTAALNNHFGKISLAYTGNKYSADLLWQEGVKPLGSDCAYTAYLLKVSKF